MATATEAGPAPGAVHTEEPKASLAVVPPRPRPHRWVSWWSRSWLASLPVAAAALVMTLSVRFFRELGFTQTDFNLHSVVTLNAAPRTIELMHHEVITRLTWALAGLCLVLACITVVVTSVWIILECLRGHRRWLIGFLIAPAALALAFAWQINLAAEDGMDLTDGLIRQVAERAGIPGVFAIGVRFAMLALAGALFMLAASSAIVLSSGWITSGRVALTGEEREVGPVRLLASRISWVRWLLYLGTVLLVAGVMEVGGFHRLPTPYLSPTDAKCVDAIASMTSLSAGTVLTLMLLAIYGPAALILRMRVFALAARENPENPEVWIKEHGLDSSVPQHLTRLAAVLAPLLAGGPFTALLKALGI
jgi:hypothetical protein